MPAAPEQLVICTTGFLGDELRAIVHKIREAGHHYERDLSASTKILIARQAESLKWIQCVERRIPIVTQGWASEAHCSIQKKQDYAAPALLGLSLCSTSLSARDRKKLEDLCRHHQGNCSNSLDRQCNYLVVPAEAPPSLVTEKTHFAKKEGIPLLPISELISRVQQHTSVYQEEFTGTFKASMSDFVCYCTPDTAIGHEARDLIGRSGIKRVPVVTSNTTHVVVLGPSYERITPARPSQELVPVTLKWLKACVEQQQVVSDKPYRTTMPSPPVITLSCIHPSARPELAQKIVELEGATNHELVLGFDGMRKVTATTHLVVGATTLEELCGGTVPNQFSLGGPPPTSALASPKVQALIQRYQQTRRADALLVSVRWIEASVAEGRWVDPRSYAFSVRELPLLNKGDQSTAGLPGFAPVDPAIVKGTMSSFEGGSPLQPAGFPIPPPLVPIFAHPVNGSSDSPMGGGKCNGNTSHNARSPRVALSPQRQLNTSNGSSQGRAKEEGPAVPTHQQPVTSSCSMLLEEMLAHMEGTVGEKISSSSAASGLNPVLGLVRRKGTTAGSPRTSHQPSLENAAGCTVNPTTTTGSTGTTRRSGSSVVSNSGTTGGGFGLHTMRRQLSITTEPCNTGPVFGCENVRPLGPGGAAIESQVVGYAHGSQHQARGSSSGGNVIISPQAPGQWEGGVPISPPHPGGTALRKFALSVLPGTDELRSMIESLGGQLVTTPEQCTHLLLARPGKTATMLTSIAAGRWILQPEYVLQSKRAGRWLEETPFEWNAEKLPETDRGNVALVAGCRLQRLAGGGRFATWKAALCCSSPTRALNFARLLAAGGCEHVERLDLQQVGGGGSSGADGALAVWDLAPNQVLELGAPTHVLCDEEACNAAILDKVKLVVQRSAIASSAASVDPILFRMDYIVHTLTVPQDSTTDALYSAFRPSRKRPRQGTGGESGGQ